MQTMRTERRNRQLNNNIGDSKGPLSAMAGASRQKINKESKDLNTINHLDITDMYTTFHPTEAKHTLFSSIHRTFQRIDYMLNNKTILNKFKFTETYKVFCENLPTTME